MNFRLALFPRKMFAQQDARPSRRKGAIYFDILSSSCFDPFQGNGTLARVVAHLIWLRCSRMEARLFRIMSATFSCVNTTYFIAIRIIWINLRWPLQISTHKMVFIIHSFHTISDFFIKFLKFCLTQWFFSFYSLLFGYLLQKSQSQID